MRRIKLLIIAIIIVIISISVTIIKLEKKTATLQKRIETVEEDLHTIETKLRSQRLITSYSPFAIDIVEMKTIQEKILRYFKLEYVETFAQKKLIKRRWR